MRMLNAFRRVVVRTLLGLMLVNSTAIVCAQDRASAIRSPQFAQVGESPMPSEPKNPSPSARQPANPQTRSKAGFLAGAGLAILALLVLAAGLALLRAFKP
jgi:hypothetical protein